MRVCVSVCVQGAAPGDFGFTKETKESKSDAIRFGFLSYQFLSGQSFLIGEKAFIWKKLGPSGPSMCAQPHKNTHTQQVIGSLVELGGQRIEGKRSCQVYLSSLTGLKPTSIQSRCSAGWRGEGGLRWVNFPCSTGPIPAVFCLTRSNIYGLHPAKQQRNML